MTYEDLTCNLLVHALSLPVSRSMQDLRSRGNKRLHVDQEGGATSSSQRQRNPCPPLLLIDSGLLRLSLKYRVYLAYSFHDNGR